MQTCIFHSQQTKDTNNPRLRNLHLNTITKKEWDTAIPVQRSLIYFVCFDQGTVSYSLGWTQCSQRWPLPLDPPASSPKCQEYRNMTPQLALSMFFIRERRKLLSGNYSSVPLYVHKCTCNSLECFWDGSNAVQATLNLLWRQGWPSTLHPLVSIPQVLSELISYWLLKLLRA